MCRWSPRWLSTLPLLTPQKSGSPTRNSSDQKVAPGLKWHQLLQLKIVKFFADRTGPPNRTRIFLKLNAIFCCFPPTFLFFDEFGQAKLVPLSEPVPLFGIIHKFLNLFLPVKRYTKACLLLNFFVTSLFDRWPNS